MRQATFLSTKTGQWLQIPFWAICTYIFACLAIDRGNIWYYAATFISLGLAIRQLIRQIRRK